MSRFYRLIGNLLLVPLLSLSLSFSLALATEADPPGHIGRIAHIEGEVGFRAQRDEAPDPATRNWPLSSGAVLETGAQSRAEAWIGSSALRLDETGWLEFAIIDEHETLLDLDAGRLGLSILDAEQAADLRLRLPDAQIRFDAPGRYRVEVLADRSALTVFAGHARIEHKGDSAPLSAGKRATLFSDGSFRIDAAGPPDAFDLWVAERENASVANTARSHVSPYMTGYQDLDAHGDWTSHAEYGAIWMPRALAVDWAPYRFGRWAWITPWGWTWIDAAPWGFAPFHYGRWVMIGGRWAWAPGRRTVRPVYAPALVGWIGNPGWSLSFGFGAAPAVGWFPLGPREVYVPRYRYSPAHIWRINITHVHDVNLIERAARGGPPRFVYRDSPKAVTVAPARQLREGRPIGPRDFQRIERQDLARAPMSASHNWLSPAAEARRPQAAARPSPPGSPGFSGANGRSEPLGRNPARPSAASFGAASNHADGAAAPAPREPWPASRQPLAESRDMGRSAATPGFRQPLVTPAQGPRQAPQLRVERPAPTGAPSATPFRTPPPSLPRGDAFSRPAAGTPHAPPSRTLSSPDSHRETRDIVRPAQRMEAGQGFRRAEPAMRGPTSSGNGPRGGGGRH